MPSDSQKIRVAYWDTLGFKRTGTIEFMIERSPQMTNLREDEHYCMIADDDPALNVHGGSGTGLPFMYAEIRKSSEIVRLDDPDATHGGMFND